MKGGLKKNLENYEEPTDEDELYYENVEQQMDAQNEYYEDTSPTEQERDSLYSLFWKIIEKKDSSKVGNLEKHELGLLDMSVRDCQAIALLCDSVNYTETAKWLRRKAEITLATSSSKRGWLPELFVSAKRFSSKEKRMGVPGEGMPMPQQQEKKSFWNRIKGK